MKKLLLYSLSALLSYTAIAQPGTGYRPVLLIPGLHLPKDTATANLLLQSLNGLLEQKEQDNEKNSYVWQKELPATSVLLDELKGIEQNREGKQEHFYQAYLGNVVRLADSSYLLQLSYCGINKDQAELKASFHLVARREKDRFYFYSPLKRNSRGWKSLKGGQVTFYYRDRIDTQKAKAYQQCNDSYLKKLGNGNNQTILYCCDDMPEALQLMGVDYQKDYNGRNSGSLSSTQQNKTVVVNGSLTPDFRHFDPHDMWHEKLRTVLSVNQTYRPMDEGCAYLYGGSWGYSWAEIKTLFKAYHQQHPDTDWLQLYTAGTNFKEGNEYLSVGYFLNALIAQELEREKGFAAVMALLSCGKKEKDDENYFKALEKTAGVTKAGFNAHVSKLMKDI